MELKIKKLTIQNFEGFKNFEFDFAGKNYNIYGDNEVGKTTIFDAFTWALFGKDSLGATAFDIKPIDQKTGEAIHNLESVVELLLDHDGKELLLKRVYREIWRGKRGNEQEITGHETLVYINEEKVGVREYENFIKSLIDENIFKILTNVYYFNGILNPEERRDILFSLFNDLTDEDIIKANPALHALKKHLPEGRTIAALKKILIERIKKITAELKEYPIRIAALSDVKYKIPENYDIEKNKIALEETYAKQKELEQAKASGSNAGKITELSAAIKAFDADIENYNRQREKLSSDAEFEKMQALRKITGTLSEIRGEIERYKIEINNYEIRKKNGLQTIDEEKNKRQEIYQKYPIERDRVFTPEKCSYCGQELPPEMVAELEKKFNLEKANKLTDLQSKGEAINARVKQFETAINNFDEKIAEYEQAKKDATDKLETKKSEYNDVYDAPIKVDDSEILAKIKSAKERRAVVLSTLEKLKAKEDMTEIDLELKSLKDEIERLVACRTEYSIRESNKEHIQKLTQEQKNLLKQSEENIFLRDLCDKFTVIKRNYQQKKLNTCFEITKFRLFEEYLSGGIRETCIAMYRGVPYNGSLNNAAKINVGLDVIKTLQKIYDIKVPIFIDNAESTTKYLSLDGQVIKMYVSEPDKILRFEEAGEDRPFIQTEKTREEREVI